MPDIEFLTIADVIFAHEGQLELYGGDSGLSDLGLLESAVAQDCATFGGSYLHAFPTSHSPRLANPKDRDDTSDIVRKADAAMAGAAKDVVEGARRHNSPIVLWRDGQVVELNPFSAKFDEPKTDGERQGDAP